MDNATRAGVILAAVNAAGPATNYTTPVEDGQGNTTHVPDAAAYQAAVTEHAVEIALMLDENSDVSKAIEAMQSAKVFTGTVVAVRKQQSSTRGVITLHTGTDRARDGVAAGCEEVRTERTDNPVGLRMAKKTRRLIGHKVLVRVVVEEFNGGQGKVRVLHHVTDLGVDPDFEAKKAS